MHIGLLLCIDESFCSMSNFLADLPKLHDSKYFFFRQVIRPRTCFTAIHSCRPLQFVLWLWMVLHATMHACMQVTEHIGASRLSAFMVIGISALENSLAKVDFFLFIWKSLGFVVHLQVMVAICQSSKTI